MMSEQQSAMIEWINPQSLRPHPMNERIYGVDGYQDLIESIKELGVLQAIYCTSNNIIISGHRRWHASLEAGVNSIPIIRKDHTDSIDERRAIFLMLATAHALLCQRTRGKQWPRYWRTSIIKARMLALVASKSPTKSSLYSHAPNSP